MSFYKETIIQGARKVHRCNWCHERIERGNSYRRIIGTEAGDFFRAKYHPECNSAITEYCIENNAFGEELPDEPMQRGGIEPK